SAPREGLAGFSAPSCDGDQSKSQGKPLGSMKHTVRSSALQMTVTCGTVSVLPGVDVGKIPKAAVGKELRKHHIPVIAVVSAVLLSVLMLTSVPMLWMWKKYL
ncbi:hypothetical protein CIB84_008263, partial [Bambusicola thoracicus]